jgi:prophage regulatory protein
MPALSGLRSHQKQPAGGSAAVHEPDRIIRLRTVLARTGLSRSTIYRKIADGTFPPQIKISINGSGWHESDINRWIADPVSWRPKRVRCGLTRSVVACCLMTVNRTGIRP